MNQILPSTSELTPSIRVLDEWQEVIPEDLYIPPAAFEILLEQFEGPLDFLIYLIQKNGFDLLQLDISPIATQYLSYMDSMKSLNIELTADYMVMAALLADLKSRLLLPKPTAIDQFEKDPKQELIDRLETYLRIKQAAERLGQMPIFERDTFSTNVSIGHIAPIYEGYDVEALHDALFYETSPGPLKYAASLLGLCSSEARLPIVEIEEVSKTNVKDALGKAGLL